MIYASDLDRTLIYSKTFLDMHPCKDLMYIVDKSKTDSFISRKVYLELINLCKLPGLKFIPVTTRSIEEYNRIKLPQINPKYAIVSNGGTIIKDGEVLDEWNELISENIDYSVFPDIQNDLDNADYTQYKSKIVDNCFIFSKASNLKDALAGIDVLQRKYPDIKFRMDKHKIYAIPRIISKCGALKFIEGLAGDKVEVASGDGPFDISMLNIAKIKVIPSHNKIDESEKEKLDNLKIVDGGAMSPIQTFNLVKQLYRIS